MSFLERPNAIRPASGEAPFHLSEVFYSRTDDRGLIQFGNDIFYRVAHFDPSEMKGAPHNIIRHPDMPRGVFWLFWDAIKRGRSMGAYVKNKAKDGLYYWVYAIVIPSGDGYLSVRIKPTSPVFETIKKEYANLLCAQQSEGLSPEDSAKKLLKKLNELGFDSYHSFAAHALTEELTARNTGLGKATNFSLQDYRSRHESAKELAKETDALVQEFEAMRTIPHNLRVIASRIEPAGGPVTVLSQNYGTMSRDMSDWFATHVLGENSNFAAIKGIVNHSMFIECMVRILDECNDMLQKEHGSIGGKELGKERELLSDLVQEQRNQARQGQKNVSKEAECILKACSVMHRHFLGLSSTRVLCKIESARLTNEGEALTAIIDQLGVFQGRISAQLDRIAALGVEIQATEG